MLGSSAHHFALAFSYGSQVLWFNNSVNWIAKQCVHSSGGECFMLGVANWIIASIGHSYKMMLMRAHIWFIFFLRLKKHYSTWILFKCICYFKTQLELTLTAYDSCSGRRWILALHLVRNSIVPSKITENKPRTLWQT